MKRESVRKLTRLAVLLAIEIILSRFCSISAWNLKIGFSFLPVAAAAMLYGPLAGAAVGGLGDFLGAVLFPIGPYFPGFTLTAALTGAVYGIFLGRRVTVGRILGTVAVNQLVLSLLVNTLWISILYTSPYALLLTTRVIQCAVMAPVQLLLLDVLRRGLAHLPERQAAGCGD